MAFAGKILLSLSLTFSISLSCSISLTCSTQALAQAATPPPPAVGVVKAEKKPITESNEFIGRIQAINRVEVVARVTAFLEKVEFKDGQEVKNKLLYTSNLYILSVLN